VGDQIVRGEDLDHAGRAALRFLTLARVLEDTVRFTRDSRTAGVDVIRDLNADNADVLMAFQSSAVAAALALRSMADRVAPGFTLDAGPPPGKADEGPEKDPFDVSTRQGAENALLVLERAGVILDKGTLKSLDKTQRTEGLRWAIAAYEARGGPDPGPSPWFIYQPPNGGKLVDQNPGG
jgi:hypothetical protein